MKIKMLKTRPPNKRIMEIHCLKKGKYRVKCRPEERKVKSIFPKWWCFNCRRYILPDNLHKPVFIEEVMDNADIRISVH